MGSNPSKHEFRPTFDCKCNSDNLGYQIGLEKKFKVSNEDLFILRQEHMEMWIIEK